MNSICIDSSVVGEHRCTDEKKLNNFVENDIFDQSCEKMVCPSSFFLPAKKSKYEVELDSLIYSYLRKFYVHRSGTIT